MLELKNACPKDFLQVKGAQFFLIILGGGGWGGGWLVTPLTLSPSPPKFVTDMTLS